MKAHRSARLFPGWLPSGDKVFNSPEEYFYAATKVGICPNCHSPVKKVPRHPGQFFCPREGTWDLKSYFWRQLDQGICPTCTADVVKNGPKGKYNQKLYCANEKKTFVFDPQGGLRRRSFGLDPDTLQQAVALWMLGWTPNRIQRVLRGNRKRILGLFSMKTARIELADVVCGIQDGYRHIYQALWQQLQEVGRDESLEIPLPEAKPLRENWAFHKYIALIISEPDERVRRRAAGQLAKAVSGILIQMACGVLAKRQLEQYMREAPQHFQELSIHSDSDKVVPLIKRFRERGICIDCGRRILTDQKNPIWKKIDERVHRFQNCHAIRRVFGELKTIPLNQDTEPADPNDHVLREHEVAGTAKELRDSQEHNE